MRYPEQLIVPMRQDLAQYGVKEARTVEEVNRLLAPADMKDAFESYIARSLTEEISFLFFRSREAYFDKITIFYKTGRKVSSVEESESIHGLSKFSFDFFILIIINQYLINFYP